MRAYSINVYKRVYEQIIHLWVDKIISNNNINSPGLGTLPPLVFPVIRLQPVPKPGRRSIYQTSKHQSENATWKKWK